uniref:RNA methyltransferase n=1 Tax=Megaselia scalaris TaxID=36166 RepID=T1GH14_MEGSC
MEELQSSSPKKKLSVTSKLPLKQKSASKNKFIYGNYSRYYNYRNLNEEADPRIEAFLENRDLFDHKRVLDIGCNSGFVTKELSKKTALKEIIGIDIDAGIIQRNTNHIKRLRKGSHSVQNNNNKEFPFNISFVAGNYIVKDEVLLEIEKPQFDLILCLSVTKWFHLNFGDKGLKLAFKRMFLQLNEGGKLVLEAQPYESYNRRKKLTDEIFKNYRNITFFPKDFEKYLLSEEVVLNQSELWNSQNTL